MPESGCSRQLNSQWGCKKVPSPDIISIKFKAARDGLPVALLWGTQFLCQSDAEFDAVDEACLLVEAVKAAKGSFIPIVQSLTKHTFESFFCKD